MALDYFAVGLTTLLSLVLFGGSLLLSRFLAPHQPSPEKACPYECGMTPIGQFWSQMHLRYYLFAILFLIFDIEIIFLFPWAIVFLKSIPAVFYEMLIFIAILLFGLLYSWKKGILQWK